jgi:hypothetical protein
MLLAIEKIDDSHPNVVGYVFMPFAANAHSKY